MELQEKLGEGLRRKTESLLIFAILLGFGFFVNRGVELKGLYMDDLYLWSCYGEQSFTEYVFPVGGSRFRFVFYLASWLELLFLGNHVEWMVPFNIILNSLIAFSIYRMCLSFSGQRKAVSLVLSLVFLSSRMTYYQVGQFYGLMESLGLWAAIGILYLLFRYVNGKDGAAYLGACLLYFLASFIHERYMVLFPALLLALAFGTAEGAGNGRNEEEEWESRMAARPGKGRSRGRGNGRQNQVSETVSVPKWSLLLVTLGVFALIQGIRFVTIGTLSPAGTGGTDVADTFRLTDAISHAWEQVAFVFGRNSGPDYLCILPFADSPDGIRMLILLSNVVLAAAVAAFAVGWARDRGRFFFHLKNVVLFLVFIALCIGSSSVTIRVEMRWVYVVFALALLFLSYMTSVMGKAGVLVFLYAALAVPAEMFYRDNWKNLYLWPEQMKYNSLAEQTIERYGDQIFEKDVYIIGNTYEMSDFTAETFFKVYDPERKAEGTVVQHIDSIYEIGLVTDQMLVLREDPEHNGFQDITRFVRDLKLDVEYGLYDDGWLDEDSSFHVLAGQTGTVSLTFMYPGVLSGGEETEIYVDGELYQTIPVTENVYYAQIQAKAGQVLDIQIKNNFYMQNAQEQRGETRLATLVEIAAD